MYLDSASPNGRRALAALAAAGCASLMGCSGTPKQLHAEEDSRPIVTARGVVRAEGGAAGLEVELSQVKASNDQTLQAFDIVSLGGASIVGPGPVHNDAKVSQAQVVYNHRLFAGRPVELEWFAGAAWVRTRWVAHSDNPADPHLSSTSTWYGPAGGALARVHLAPMLSFEARISAAVRTGGNGYEGERRFTEVALALRPAPSLVLRGGVAEARSWVRPEGGGSELSVRARGPFLNLGLEF